MGHGGSDYKGAAGERLACMGGSVVGVWPIEG